MAIHNDKVKRIGWKTLDRCGIFGNELRRDVMFDRNFDQAYLYQAIQALTSQFLTNMFRP